MDDTDRKRRMDELDAKIAAMKAAKAPPKRHQEEHYSQAQLAWRMVVELVAGLGIGFGIGYGLDALLDTRPWFLVLFTLLGFAAGVNVMIRSAKEIQEQKMAEQAEEDERTEDGN
ncbi:MULTISPECIES: AtpZ/AtpI family protein [unclassified Roseivivax]|uniref:AtpZ/AtpI family protein n=1 Tax=unclassified Roseivivax TaxID=2639302 RepID=UPI0012696B4C|nr:MULTISPECIES: AtpZ/AtpI family protein [unclassified Roseivivax]